MEMRVQDTGASTGGYAAGARICKQMEDSAGALQHCQTGEGVVVKRVVE